MGLIRQLSAGGAQLGVWQMTEPLEELRSRYTLLPGEEAQYKGFRNDRRRCEWLTVRLLLAELLGPGHQIAYRPSGRPYLTLTERCIGITHTIGYVGVRLSTSPVALDMEYRSERVLRLLPRFATSEEMQLLEGWDAATAGLILWSAKETMYKLFELHDVDFQRHLRIVSLHGAATEGHFRGRIDHDGFQAEVRLRYFLLDDLITVYA